MTSPAPRPLFDSYALPRSRRREGPAAALSFLAHVTIALLVLWRGAVFIENGGGGGSGPRGGGGGGERPVTSWVALPALPAPRGETPAIPPPAVTVPTVAAPPTQPVKLDIQRSLVATAPPDSVGREDGTSSGAGTGPGTGGGTGTGTGPGKGSDAGPGSGGAASDIFGPTPLLVPTVPSGAPPDDKKKHEVRFWIRADGRVTRIEVTPQIRDSGYRRRFMDSMRDYVFGPAKTKDGRPIDYVFTIVVYP